MIKLYDLAVVTSKFTNSDGQEKTRWENVGAMFEKSDSKKFIMLKAHFNPAAIQRKEGQDAIAISLFEPKKRNENRNYEPDVPVYDTQPQNFNQDFELDPDNIPF